MPLVALVGLSDAALKEELERAGLTTCCFDVSIAAIEDVLRRPFDIVVLDLEGTGPHAMSVCEQLATRRSVIGVTADRGVETCLAAFAVGASDCVRRPFPRRELAARIRNVLWRSDSPKTSPSEAHDGVVVSVDAMRIVSGERTLDLTSGEAEILRILIMRSPSPVTVAQMAEALSGRKTVAVRTIESRIKSLRRKLGPQHLVNRVRFGYQLEGVVTTLTDIGRAPTRD